MSALSEYLKLIPKGIANLEKVVEGITNSVRMDFNALPTDKQDEIIRRRLICQTCPYNSVNAQASPEYVLLHNKHYSTDRKDFHCSICKCPISTKTASLESNCGLETYNSSHPENLQPLKWTKYDT